MPNHVTNIIEAPEEVIKFIINPELDEVDFNILIPMPACLHVSADSKCQHLANLVCGKLRTPAIPDILINLTISSVGRDLSNGGALAFSHDEFETFVQMVRNIREHGFPSWYEWSVSNWDTKWNAYGTSLEDSDKLRFNTAWSAPHNVIKALSAKFPDHPILHSWADEDIGNNCGRNLYNEGICVDSFDIEDHIDFALTVIGDERENYRINADTGMWEWDDQDDEEEVEHDS